MIGNLETKCRRRFTPADVFHSKVNGEKIEN